MPAKHQDFLKALSQQPRLQSYVKKSGDPELIAQYNETVKQLIEFCEKHIILVTQYIVAQIKHTVNPSLVERGTGGTPFMNFLKGCRDSTKNLLVEKE